MQTLINRKKEHSHSPVLSLSVVLLHVRIDSGIPAQGWVHSQRRGKFHSAVEEHSVKDFAAAGD